MEQRRLRHGDYTIGWVCALPIELAAARQMLDEEHLAQFKLLVLPNVAALSDSQCEQLKKFVARGGS